MDTTTPSTLTSSDRAPLQAGVLEHRDLHALVIETNVRTGQSITLEAGFIDSIRANGVLVPVLA